MTSFLGCAMQLHGSWSHGWMIYILWKIEVKNDDAYDNDTFNEKTANRWYEDLTRTWNISGI